MNDAHLEMIKKSENRLKDFKEKLPKLAQAFTETTSSAVGALALGEFIAMKKFIAHEEEWLQTLKDLLV